MSRDALLFESGILLVVAGALAAYSWVSGKSLLIYQLVSKDDDPAKYWIATALITVCAVISLVAVVHLALEHAV